MGILGIQAIYPTKKKLTHLKNQEYKTYPTPFLAPIFRHNKIQIYFKD